MSVCLLLCEHLRLTHVDLIGNIRLIGSRILRLLEPYSLILLNLNSCQTFLFLLDSLPSCSLDYKASKEADNKDYNTRKPDGHVVVFVVAAAGVVGVVVIAAVAVWTHGIIVVLVGGLAVIVTCAAV